MNYFYAFLLFASGALLVFVYFTLYPPQCPGCKQKKTAETLWDQIRNQPVSHNLNQQDEDI